MNAANASTFKVGLIQMRSGIDPQANLAAAVASIEEAKRAGADYVLTPEMTNILALKRDQLFAAIVAEEHDPTLARLRELARKLGIYVHIGSLAIKASPEKAVNRSFLINRKGDIATAESIRERFNSLEPLRNAYGPIPVLHHAVALAGIAETGPALPLVANLGDELLDEILPAAEGLLAWNRA